MRKLNVLPVVPCRNVAALCLTLVVLNLQAQDATLKKTYFSIGFAHDIVSAPSAAVPLIFTVSMSKKRNYYLGVRFDIGQTRKKRDVVINPGPEGYTGELKSTLTRPVMAVVQRYYFGKKEKSAWFADLDIGYKYFAQEVSTKAGYTPVIPLPYSFEVYDERQHSGFVSFGAGYFLKVHRVIGFYFKTELSFSKPFDYVDPKSVEYHEFDSSYEMRSLPAAYLGISLGVML